MKFLLIFLTIFAAIGCNRQSTGPSQSQTSNYSIDSRANSTNSNANANLYAFNESLPPTSEEFNVPANVMWFDTGVTLEKDKWVMIQAKGEWSYGKGFFDPEGKLNYLRQDALLDRVEVGALVGKVNDETFYIGQRMHMPGTGGGKLYLSINDAPGSFADNKGSLKVYVTYPQRKDGR